MIRNRPEGHFGLPYYKGLPPLPYALELQFIPELVKLAILPLRHVEPMTIPMLEQVDYIIEHAPTEQELATYAAMDADFQLIFVVVNSVFREFRDGASRLLPYSISLLPASKRGNVESSKTQFVMMMRDATMFQEGSAYLGLDPFSGHWDFYSQIDLIASMGQTQGYTDQLGLVYDYFFLRTDVNMTTVVQPALGMPEAKTRRYLKHRSKLLYTPFSTLMSRQIWGVENALELFVYEEINRRLLPVPIPQALIFKDGSWHPSLYHAWNAFGEENSADLLSEVDFLFSDIKLAVFCDGAKHRRLAIQKRDAEIDKKLSELGYKAIRFSSKSILTNVEKVVDTIASAM